MRMNPRDMAALNAAIAHHQLQAAITLNQLLDARLTVLEVLIRHTHAQIDIVPPPFSHPLWRDAGTCRLTPEEETLTTRLGDCQIRWTMPRGESELRRVAHLARQVH